MLPLTKHEQSPTARAAGSARDAGTKSSASAATSPAMSEATGMSSGLSRSHLRVVLPPAELKQTNLYHSIFLPQSVCACVKLPVHSSPQA